MKLKKMLYCVLAFVVFPIMSSANAEEKELFKAVYDMSDTAADGENGVVFEQEVPDGDYTVTVTTGGKTETKANVYINGGERVRAYTLEAGKTQENEQPVVPKDGKITVQVLGESPNVTEIKIEQLPERTEKGDKLTIYVAGDSTAQTYDYAKVYPQTGWGQVFGDYFTDDVSVENRAMGGRSSKSYNNDGRLDRILTEMHPGDYVFIQFGINDGAENKPERYISTEDYKKLITEKYIGEVKKRGGVPILLTPTAASWWDEEKNEFMESRQDYAVPTKEIAEETGVTLIDINEIMTKSWNSMDKAEVLGGYFICEPLESKAYPVGTDDHTHIKESGARVIAQMIITDFSEKLPELMPYIKLSSIPSDIENHWVSTLVHDESDINIFDVIDGYEDGTFRPDNSVTRAEFLKMVMAACNIPGHAYRDLSMLGVAEDDWYRFYAQSAADKGLIPWTMLDDCIGTAETDYVISEATDDKEAVTAKITEYKPADGQSVMAFKGDEPITREEMAAVLMNCVSYYQKNGSSGFTAQTKEESFADIDAAADAYKNAVEAAYSYGFIEGDDNLMFNPKSGLTRAEAVTVIYNIGNLK